jgi:hypothetical protein
MNYAGSLKHAIRLVATKIAVATLLLMHTKRVIGDGLEEGRGYLVLGDGTLGRA